MPKSASEKKSLVHSPYSQRADSKSLMAESNALINQSRERGIDDSDVEGVVVENCNLKCLIAYLENENRICDKRISQLLEAL